ncbi:MAG: flagellar biosynthesis anti-sigma factor FlgM [Desulfobacterales bacterium]|nr:flagellar biosynthesis anti-sigma factor FlgM [Desulfobacterales bacterium]
MKIFDATNTYERQAQIKEASEQDKTKESTKRERTDRPEQETTSEDVVVSLSETSREMQLAEEAVAESQDVRQEMVEEARMAYQNGQYPLDADQVANKMVGSIISEQV